MQSPALSRLPNLKRQQNRRTLNLILIGTLLPLGLWFFLSLWSIISTQAIQLDQPIQLTERGDAIQNNQIVGHLLRHGSHLELSLPLSSTKDQEPKSAVFTISLPKAAHNGQPEFTFTSIQNSRTFLATPLSPTVIQIYALSLLPESHTFLKFTLPSDYLRLPLPLLIYSWLRYLPLNAWLNFAVLLLILVLVLNFLKTRRPLSRTRAEISQPPGQLTVLEMAILLDGHIRLNHLVALLYDLANRGFLEIIEQSTEILLLRTSKESELPFHEQLFLRFLTPTGSQPNSLAEIIASTNRQLFSKVVSYVYIETYNSLTKRALFTNNLRSQHLYYKTFGIITQFLSLSLAGLSFWLLPQTPGLLILSCAGYLSGVIIYGLGYRLLPFTRTGYRANQDVHAFINFLTSHQPIEQPAGQAASLFFTYLPYALVAKVEREWLQRFGEVNFSIPDWFSSSQTEYFRPETFMQEVARISTYLAKLFIKAKDPNVD